MSDVDDKSDNHGNHDNHAPNAEFRASLGREVARAYRAEMRFGSDYGRRTHRLGVVIGLTMGAVVTLTIGLVLGASTGYASAEVLTEHQRQVTATALETARRFDAFRLRLAETNYQRTQSDFAKGVATTEALQAAKTELDTMRASVSRAELDLRDTRDNVSLPRPAFAILRGFTTRDVRAVQNCAPMTTAAQAQIPSVAQQGVSVVDLPAATAKTTDTFGAILNVRELPGGKVLIDDGRNHQIKLADSSLATSTTVIDSTTGAAVSYGPVPQALIPYLADSTLFPDGRARTMSVIDPHGALARTLAMPAENVPLPRHDAGVDNLGRLIFAGERTVIRPKIPGGELSAADSVPILRADFALRRTDTIGYWAMPLTKIDGLPTQTLPTQANRMINAWIPDFLQPTDVWSVLSDGSIAIVRGHDYHIDWIRPDGTAASTPKLPFDWKQLTDADKQRLIDSTRIQFKAAADNGTLFVNSEMLTVTGRSKAADLAARTGRHSDDGSAGSLLATRTTPSGLKVDVVVPEPAPLSHVFDYYPAVRNGAAIPDLDGHLWILPTTSKQSKQGELVYDVVNSKGELVERVRVPLGHFIVGFGKGGVVYTASGSLTTGFTLERSKLPNGRRP